MAAMQLADKGGILFNFEANSRYWLNSARFLESVVERALGVAGAEGGRAKQRVGNWGIVQRCGAIAGGDTGKTMVPPTTGP